MTERVLLSIGDPNGIGPEISVAAARAARHPPVLVGDREVVERAAGGLTVRDHRPDLPAEPGVLDLIDVGALPPGEQRPGAVEAAAGAATIAYARTAIRAAATGRYRAVVAGPHSETAVHAAGIPFRGYPPFVAETTGTPPDEVFLLLIGGGLRIVHATLHERLADALGRLDAVLVAAAARALCRALADLGVPGRVAVFGVNPHAGEGGLFGDDDERISVPAVTAVRAEGLPVDGPTGADILLARRFHAGYVAMYHDQGHVPVKLLAGNSAVALTIGAGVPFCSVGHGTAFDIVGTGRADPEALLRALDVVG